MSIADNKRALDVVIQHKFNNEIKDLNIYVEETLKQYITEKRDGNSNIIDQKYGKTYNLLPEFISGLMGHLNRCRLNNGITHYSEKQYNNNIKYSGLMLDFDLIVPFGDINSINITEDMYQSMTLELFEELYNSVSFNINETFYIFFIQKTKLTLINKVEDNNPPLFKFGFHILVPNLQLTKAHKKWILFKLKDNTKFNRNLKKMKDVRGDLSLCLDKNSASVPVLFFGSCKNKENSLPYILGNARVVKCGCDDNITSKSLDIPKLEQLGYNLTAEMGLIYDAIYLSNIEVQLQPLVVRKHYECIPSLSDQIHDLDIRREDNILELEEIEDIDRNLSILTLHNPDASRYKQFLDMLTPNYYEERENWRNIIYALSSAGDSFKPLAIWFSQKCPQKYSLQAIESLWNEKDAIGPNSSKITLKSIPYYAKLSNPQKYQEVCHNSYVNILNNYVYNYGGKLQHSMIADLLFNMLGTKFCTDIDVGSKGANSYCWFEFVVGGQLMKKGEVWKWRKEVDPDEIQLFISQKLTIIFDMVSSSLDEKCREPKDENTGKAMKEIKKNFKLSMGSLYNDGFKKGIISQCNYIFRKRGFVDQLDKIPYLFGVANGVLKLGYKCELIDYYHEYPISRFTPVEFVRFDPEDEMTKLALKCIEDIIFEPDARDWILFHAAQGLSSSVKDGLFLLWEGGGQNGKTTFLRLVAKALGSYADKFNIQLMCSDRENADKANSAMMKFKHLNWAYAEESNKAQVLNTARMKEMVNAGEVSGRELHSKQETFTMKCNIVAASQYSFIVNTTDHGTWRRICHYNSKTKFRKNPDLNNPFEKKDDQRYNQELPDNPVFQSRILSILVHYYERLQNEYGGMLKNVRSPTIESETDKFRNGQDALHKWICTYVVLGTEKTAKDYNLDAVAYKYNEWYSRTFNEGKKQSLVDVQKEIESSSISKFLKPSLNRIQVLKNCRILETSEPNILEGEEYILIAENKRGQQMDEYKPKIYTNKWWE